MDKESQIISLRANAVTDLVQLKSIEEAKEYHSMTKSWTEYARAKKIDTELLVLIKEQSIRTERIIGQLINKGRESGELAKKGEPKAVGNQYQSAHVPEENMGKKTLPELGISKKQSAKYQKLAAIPDADFEAFIGEKKENVDRAVNELTTAGAIRMSQSAAANEVEYQNKVAVKAAIDDRISELLQEINKWPKLYRVKIVAGIKK